MPVAKLLAPRRASSRLVALTPLLALALCADITNSARAQGADYTFTALDDPAGTATYISGINNLGQVVGYYRGSNNHFDGFLYTPGVGFQTLNDPQGTGSSGTTPTGINDLGQVIGQYNTAGNFDFSSLYTAAGGFTNLDGANGPYIPGVSGINASGQIVGTNQSNQGYLYTPGTGTAGGSFTLLNDPLAASSTPTSPAGVNSSDQVVGIYTAGGLNHGFLYTDGAYMTLDDPLAAASFNATFANGLNDAGEVVGFYQVANGNTDGFLYTPTGGFTTVNDPLGVGDSEIYGINNSGEIAGTYYDAAGVTHGFLAMPSAAPAVPEASPIALLALGLLPVGLLVARRKIAP